jgi:hypothetical protein
VVAVVDLDRFREVELDPAGRTEPLAGVSHVVPKAGLLVGRQAEIAGRRRCLGRLGDAPPVDNAAGIGVGNRLGTAKEVHTTVGVAASKILVRPPAGRPNRDVDTPPVAVKEHAGVPTRVS